MIELDYSHPAAKRFWSKVRVGAQDECWSWTAGSSKNGYGRFGVGDGVVMDAHRFAWLLVHGDPGPLCVLHHCDYRLCCNPFECLFLGTKTVNAKDRDAKGRTARGGTHGSRTHPERWARGEASGSAALTEADVRLLRARYAAGASYDELAIEFDVVRGTVSNAVTGKTWGHMPGAIQSRRRGPRVLS